VAATLSREATWNLLPQDPSACKQLGEALAISPITAQVLINRGLDSTAACAAFLSPNLQMLHDSALLPDIDIACDRLITALTQQERMCIYGDYDTDGVCGTVMMLKFLRAVGAQVDYYIPHRTKEGYGLNIPALQRILARGEHLVVTVDNGSTAHESLVWAQEHDIQVIITDHHELDGELPPALAVINPKRADSGYPFRELCGSGVALKVLIALRVRLRAMGWFTQREEPNLRHLMDLAGMATIADIVPLVDENRVIASIGLRQLASSVHVGVNALIDAAGVDRDDIGSYAVGFQLSPRINAAGRMAHASEAVDLLTTHDAKRAGILARQLHALNGERQRVERDIRDAISQQVAGDPLIHARASIVVSDESWPSGVVGIVAGRIAEEFRLPTIVIGTGNSPAHGSARSVGTFPLLEAMRACDEHLLACGGHAAAAGLTIAAENIAAFAAAFETVAQGQLRPEHRQRTLTIDADLTAADLDLGLAVELSRLEPFGLGNPSPQFIMRDLQVKSHRIVGNNHLQLQVRHGNQSIRAIAFSLGTHPAVGASGLDLLFTPSQNRWRGRTSVEMRVKDLRQSG
jgi:single-stranded-DNA-specific exonuclease